MKDPTHSINRWLAALTLAAALGLTACGGATGADGAALDATPSTPIDFELDSGINEFSFIFALMYGCFDAHPELLNNPTAEILFSPAEDDPCVLACNASLNIAYSLGWDRFGNRLNGFFNHLLTLVEDDEKVEVLRGLCIETAVSEIAADHE